MKKPLFLLIVAIILCTQYTASAEDTKKNEQCITDELGQIKTLPELEYLQTLDRRYLSLDEIFSSCRTAWQMCSLYEKFYYWLSELREIVSDTPNTSKKYWIRVYISTMDRCYPAEKDPLKIYGDVAEFYDESGSFRLLAIYLGDGQYGLYIIKRAKA